MNNNLLAIFIVSSVLVATYLVLSSVESSKQSMELQTNCATYFDMMYESWDGEGQFTNVLQGQTFLAQSFRSDKCATIVSDWEHMSQNNDIVKNSDLNWHEISYIVFDDNGRAIIID